MKIFNSSSVSSINYYDYSEFDLTKCNDFEISLVSNTDTSEDLSFYYGKRKLKDTLVVDSLPVGREFPNDKLYFVVDKNNYEIIYKDSQGVLMSISDFLKVRDVVVSGDFLKILWSTGDHTSFLITIKDGTVTDSVNKIIDQAVSKLKDQYTVKWEHFGL